MKVINALCQCSDVRCSVYFLNLSTQQNVLANEPYKMNSLIMLFLHINTLARNSVLPWIQHCGLKPAAQNNWWNSSCKLYMPVHNFLQVLFFPDLHRGQVIAKKNLPEVVDESLRWISSCSSTHNRNYKHVKQIVAEIQISWFRVWCIRESEYWK